MVFKGSRMDTKKKLSSLVVICSSNRPNPFQVGDLSIIFVIHYFAAELDRSQGNLDSWTLTSQGQKHLVPDRAGNANKVQICGISVSTEVLINDNQKNGGGGGGYFPKTQSCLNPFFLCCNALPLIEGEAIS